LIIKFTDKIQTKGITNPLSIFAEK